MENSGLDKFLYEIVRREISPVTDWGNYTVLNKENESKYS